MPTWTKLAAVILAAGDSTRMGRDKALLPLPQTANGTTETFLSAAIKAFKASSCSDVLVVAGKNAEALSALVHDNDASLLINPDPSRGQFSSLQVGLSEVLRRGCDAAFISVVDCPVSQAVLSPLQHAFRSADSAVWCLVPEYRGVHGHPYIAGRDMIEAFLHAPAACSAKEVKAQIRERVQFFTVDDERVVLNINAPADYARFCSTAPQSSPS